MNGRNIMGGRAMMTAGAAVRPQLLRLPLRTQSASFPVRRRPPSLAFRALLFLLIGLALAAGYAPAALAQSPPPPAAPTGLSARGGTNQIAVTWAATPGATTYNLYRGTAAGAETSLRVGIPPAAGTVSYTDSGINDQSGYYYYQVTAVGPGMESVRSAEVSCAGIDSPAGVTCHAGDSQVTVSWAATPGAVTYSVYRGTTPGAEAQIQSGLSSSTRIFTDSAVTDGPTYFYYVTALRAANAESAPSPEVSGTPTPPPPAAPASLALTKGDGSMGLAWAASADATSYDVYRATASGAEAAPALASGVTGTSFQDTGLTNGLAYFYVVTAANAGGESAWSPEAHDYPSGACAVPTGLSAFPGSASVALAWNSVPGASGYKVYRGPSAGALSPLASVGGVSTASVGYADATAVSGTTYYYAVASLNGSVLSGQSAAVAATPGTPPSVPTGVSAQAKGLPAGQVSLSWAASGAVTYNVYRGTSAGGELPLPAATGVSGTAWTDAGATVGAATYYKVTAVGPAAGAGAGPESAKSSESSATSLSAPAGAAAQSGNTQVSVSWGAVLGASSYSLYRGTSPGGEGATAYKTGLTRADYLDTGLTNGTAYYYKVTAVLGASSESLPSAEVSGTPTVPPPLSPPSTTLAPGNAQVSVSWTASGGATGYRVYRGTSSGSEGATPVATTGGALSYVDPGLTNGTTYWYQVTATNGGGESARPTDASATPLAPPAAPGYLSATAGGTSQVQLYWAPVPGTTGYKLERSPDGSTGWSQIASGTATGYLDTGLSAGTAYFYRVSGSDVGGSSPYATAATSTLLAAPTGLAASAGSGQVTLSWPAVAGATSYNLYRGVTAGGEAYPALAPVTGATTYTDTTAVNGKAYYYTLKAVDAGGESAASNEASATPQAPPAAPTGLTATGGNAQVSLTWTAPTGTISSYNVKRGTATGGPYTTISAAGAVTTTSYTDATAVNGTAYYYVVSAVGAGGEGANSGQASATPQSPVLAAPSAVAVSPGSAQATVSWSPVPGAATYNLYRSTSAGTEVSYRTALTGSSYYDQSLTNGTTYFYEVTAVGPGGESPRSPEASGTPNSSLPTLYPPTVLKAAPGGGLVTLAWSAAANATAYDVYRGVGSGTLFLYRSGVAATTLADTGVTNGTTYSYQVATVGAAGQSTYLSQTVYATPGSAPPSAPLEAAQSQGSGSTSVTLIWSPAAGATGYDVYRSTSAGGEGAVPVAATAGSQNGGYLTYQDSGLAAGTTYYYQVAAVNNSSSGPNAGEGAPSAEASVLTGSAQLPRPAYLTAGASGTTVTLNWSAVSGATGYNLYRQAGGQQFTLYKVGLGTASYADTGLTSGTTYGYYVAPLNAAGQGSGDYYHAVSATAGSTPLPATLLSATAGSGSVSLWWNPVAGAGSYNVYRSTSAGGEGAVPVGSITNASTTALITYSDPASGGSAPANGTRYFYKVTAVAGSGANAGEGAPSNEASATPSASGSPLSAVPGLTVHAASGQLSLNWGAASGAAGYNLYRQVGSSGPMLLYQAGVSGTSYADGSVTAGTVYGYRAVAETADGQGPLASGQGSGYLFAAAYGTPGGTSPGAPILSANYQYGSLTLNWSAVPGVSAYNVYRSAASGGEGLVPVNQVIVGGGSGGTSYQDPSPLSGQSFYQVTAVNNVGEGPKSNEAGVSTTAAALPAPTGLVATPGYGTVTLAWNPVTGATSYDVYRAASGSGPVLVAVGVTSPTFQDSGMGPDTFTYSVAGVSTSGEGAQASVTAVPNEFSLSPSSLLVTAGVGTTGEGDVGISRSGTFAPANSPDRTVNGIPGLPVLLSLSGTLPPGVTCTFFPQAPDRTGSSLYFCVGAGVAAGTYPFTLTGAAPGSPSPLTHSIQVTLTVTSP